MDNGVSGLIGLAQKAGKAQLGDEAVTLAARAHKARLILLSADAGDSILRRGALLGEQGNCPVLTLPLTKAQLGAAAGRGSCSIFAFTDVGLAAAAAKGLAGQDPEAYGAVSALLEQKAAKVLRRRKEKPRKP